MGRIVPLVIFIILIGLTIMVGNEANQRAGLSQKVASGEVAAQQATVVEIHKTVEEYLDSNKDRRYRTIYAVEVTIDGYTYMIDPDDEYYDIVAVGETFDAYIIEGEVYSPLHTPDIGADVVMAGLMLSGIPLVWFIVAEVRRQKRKSQDDGWVRVDEEDNSDDHKPV